MRKNRNQIYMIITNYSSKLSWWIVRLSVLVALLGIFYDTEILVLVSSIILIHFKLGLESIINDYIHNKFTCLLYLIFIRLSSFKLISFVLDFLL